MITSMLPLVGAASLLSIWPPRQLPTGIIFTSSSGWSQVEKKFAGIPNSLHMQMMIASKKNFHIIATPVPEMKRSSLLVWLKSRIEKKERNARSQLAVSQGSGNLHRDSQDYSQAGPLCYFCKTCCYRSVKSDFSFSHDPNQKNVNSTSLWLNAFLDASISSRAL